MRVASAWACLLAATLLSACSVLRSKPGPTPSTSLEPPVVSSPPPVADEDKPDANQPMTPPAADSQPSPANSASVDCIPPAPKAKPQPKPKPVHKEEAPPQQPTAPVVVETPPGAVVASEVKTMPVAVMSILGTKVQGPKGEDYGRLVDVLADPSGRVRVAIIDFGGFLGVGDRRIAVEWRLFRFNPADPSSVTLAVSHDKLKAVPEYKSAERPQVLMASPPPTPPAGDGKQ